jgi:hypothetical protein
MRCRRSRFKNGSAGDNTDSITAARKLPIAAQAVVVRYCHGQTDATRRIALPSIHSVQRRGSEQDRSAHSTRELLPCRSKDSTHRPLAPSPSMLMRRRMGRHAVGHACHASLVVFLELPHQVQPSEWCVDRGSMSHGSHCVSPSGLRSRSLGSMSDGCHVPIPTTCSLAKRCVGGTY